MWPIQRKLYKSTETVPEEDLMADILDKDFKTIVLNAQKTKGRCGESQENDV